MDMKIEEFVLSPAASFYEKTAAPTITGSGLYDFSKSGRETGTRYGLIVVTVPLLMNAVCKAPWKLIVPTFAPDSISIFAG